MTACSVAGSQRSSTATTGPPRFCPRAERAKVPKLYWMNLDGLEWGPFSVEEVADLAVSVRKLDVRASFFKKGGAS